MAIAGYASEALKEMNARFLAFAKATPGIALGRDRRASATADAGQRRRSHEQSDALAADTDALRWSSAWTLSAPYVVREPESIVRIRASDRRRRSPAPRPAGSARRNSGKPTPSGHAPS